LMCWCDCGRPGCESRGFSAESSKHGCKIGSDCRWSARTGKSSVRLSERGHPIRQLDIRPISGTQNHLGIMLPKISPCLWFDHQAASLLWLSQGLCLSLSVTIGAEGSHVPHYRRATETCHLHAGGRMARNRSRPYLSRDNHCLPVLTSSGILFDTSSMVHFRS